MDRRQEYFSNARMAADGGWGFLILDFKMQLQLETTLCEYQKTLF